MSLRWFPPENTGALSLAQYRDAVRPIGIFLSDTDVGRMHCRPEQLFRPPSIRPGRVRWSTVQRVGQFFLGDPPRALRSVVQRVEQRLRASTPEVATISADAQLKALGNGVVPQQAAAAARW